MQNRIVAAVVAGGLLVGAGVITSVVSAPGTALAQEETKTDERDPIPRVIGFLEEVLDDLVREGTITESQADAIVDATEKKAEAVRDELQERRELLRTFLEDDVITEEEAAQLPDDHWLFADRFDEAWEDGELSREEIRQLRPHWRRHPFRSGFRLGSVLGDDDA